MRNECYVAVGFDGTCVSHAYPKTGDDVGAIKTGKPHPLDRAVDALFHLPGAPLALGIVLIIRGVTQ